MEIIVGDNVSVSGNPDWTGIVIRIYTVNTFLKYDINNGIEVVENINFTNVTKI